MIDLARRSEPYEIDAALRSHSDGEATDHRRYGRSPGRSATSPSRRLSAKRASVRRQGCPLNGLPDLSAEGERDGFYQLQLIRELAVRHVTTPSAGGRRGAADAGEHRRGDGALPVGERFFQEFTLRQVC